MNEHKINWLCVAQVSILPTGSVVPNTDEKLLSETNALVCEAGTEAIENEHFFFVIINWHFS